MTCSALFLLDLLASLPKKLREIQILRNIIYACFAVHKKHMTNHLENLWELMRMYVIDSHLQLAIKASSFSAHKESFGECCRSKSLGPCNWPLSHNLLLRRL